MENKINSKSFGEVKNQFADSFENKGNVNLAETVRASNSSDLTDKTFMKALKLGNPELGTEIETLYEEVVRLQKEGKEAFNPEHYFKFENGSSKFFPNLLAEEIETAFEFRVIRDNEKIYVYKDGYYQSIGKDVIEEECDKRLGDKIEPSYQNRVFKVIKRRNKIDRGEFEPPISKICFENGVYDLEDEELIDHSPEYYFTHKIPWNYREDAECEEIQSFLEDIVRDEQDVKTLREIAGYTLLPDYPIAKAFMLIGKGNNGKSRFLDLLRELVGQENVTDKGLQNLENSRFASSKLEDKIACIDDDLSSERLTNTDTMKKLTGGSYIDAEIKYGGQYSFKNYAKLVFACNELPRTNDNSDGFYRRWILVEFPYSFKDQPNPEKENEKQGIPKNELMERITEKEEIEGFLWWAVEALKDVLENDEFTHAPTIEKSRDKWREYSVPIVAFIEKYIKQGTTYTEAESKADDSESVTEYDYDYIRKDFLQEVLGDYCEARDHSRPSKKKITAELKKFDFYFNPRGQSRQEPGADRVPVYSGLVLKYPDPRGCHGVNTFSSTIARVTRGKGVSNQSVDAMTGGKNRIKSSIVDFLEKGEIDEQELIRKTAEQVSVSEKFVEDTIEKMKHEGELFEPKSGYVNLI
jgi:P4 family phage/plasmid primase-like protien